MFSQFVLLLLINSQQEVLLLRRINTPFSCGSYALPGGKIEQGESALDAALREARNSLGLVLQKSDLHFAHCMYRKCNEPEFFTAVFAVDATKLSPVNTEPERHDDMQWFAFAQLPEKHIPAHGQAIEMVANGVYYSEHGW